jgi:gamma-glutamylcysteine synthetase
MSEATRIGGYAGRILEMMSGTAGSGPRTYGFEYEFIPSEVLGPHEVERVYGCLASHGFTGGGGLFSSPEGMGVSFEPGAQIEFRSLPVTADDSEGVERQLDIAASTLEMIEEETGYRYEGRGFVPGRGTAPMVLPGSRYAKMHERFGHSGTRGREMMKGTASIQLHAAIRGVDDALPLYTAMLGLTGDDLLGMGPERADIWRHTDDTRCGLAVTDAAACGSSAGLVREFVRFTLGAVDLDTGLPWGMLPDGSFGEFLAHMTTIFTDIRLNLKGVTWELRTPDSVPIERFGAIWDRFLDRMESRPGEPGPGAFVRGLEKGI